MRRALIAVVALAALATACSGGEETPSSPADSGTGSAATTGVPSPSLSIPASPTAPEGDTVTVTISDFAFDPPVVIASTDQSIELVNDGSALHNFSVDGTPIDVDVNPGETQTLAAPGSSFPAGTYTLFCKYHQAQGMVGALIALSPAT
jgi:plastocyanin